MIKMNKLISLCVAVALATMMTITGAAAEGNQLVTVDLWNANLDQPSMGNIATDYNPQALYNPESGTLQIALNPVSVSGYQSGLGGMRYDRTGNGDYVDAVTLSTIQVNIGTKYDGVDREITVLTCVEIQCPEYLTGEGVEYIALMMQVPYTPMDTVIGDGYLESRLRIDWSETTATNLTALQPDTTMSAGEVVPLRLENQGFLVNTDTNTLSEVTRLTVEKITSGSDFDLATTALAGEEFALYRINLTVGSADITPTGAIFITFPYENLDGLYRINASGSKTALFGTQEGEGYEIMTRSIGLFAVVGGEMLEVAVPAPETDSQLNFSDIDGHWAKENILGAVNLGLFNGTGDTTFSPEGYMTNAMVITVLHRMAGTPAVATTETSWYGQAMAWGYEAGIIGGYTQFDPDANATREGLATMLYRHDGLMNQSQVGGADLSKFADYAQITPWAEDAMGWANAMGIITGTDEGKIDPQNSASRAVVATILYRYASH